MLEASVRSVKEVRKKKKQNTWTALQDKSWECLRSRKYVAGHSQLLQTSQSLKLRSIDDLGGEKEKHTQKKKKQNVNQTLPTSVQYQGSCTVLWMGSLMIFGRLIVAKMFFELNRKFIFL
jgi:hypothetical protein